MQIGATSIQTPAILAGLSIMAMMSSDVSWNN